MDLLRITDTALSPLHLAARNGHAAIVNVLIEAGMDVNTVGTSGTALHEVRVPRCAFRQPMTNLEDSCRRSTLLHQHRAFSVLPSFCDGGTNLGLLHSCSSAPARSLQHHTFSPSYLRRF